MYNNFKLRFFNLSFLVDIRVVGLYFGSTYALYTL